MDWVGNIFIVLGLWLIGNKYRNAFILSIIGEVCWVIYSLQHTLFSLAFICSIFALLALRSYIKWGNNG